MSLPPLSKQESEATSLVKKGYSVFTYLKSREQGKGSLFICTWKKGPGVHHAHLCFIKTTSQRSKPSNSQTANSDTLKLTILKKKIEKKKKMIFTKMKMLWIYCIIVKSLQIDFRNREKEKRCTSISLEWTVRTLPGDNTLSFQGPLKGCRRVKDAHTDFFRCRLSIYRDSASWNAQHNHHWECSVT